MFSKSQISILKLFDLDIPRENWLSYLQAEETDRRRSLLKHSGLSI